MSLTEAQNSQRGNENTHNMSLLCSFTPQQLLNYIHFQNTQK